MAAKKKQGQKVNLIDFFGTYLAHRVLALSSECLSRKPGKVRLSDHQRAIESGTNPMPIHTAMHVKDDLVEPKFSDNWEFTPFEVAVPKYGVSMNIADFNSEFFMGSVVEKRDEVPLHYLQALFSSSFTGQINYLANNELAEDFHERLSQEIELLEANEREIESKETDLSHDFKSKLLTKRVVEPTQVCNPLKGLELELCAKEVPTKGKNIKMATATATCSCFDCSSNVQNYC